MCTFTELREHLLKQGVVFHVHRLWQEANFSKLNWNQTFHTFWKSGHMPCYIWQVIYGLYGFSFNVLQLNMTKGKTLICCHQGSTIMLAVPHMLRCPQMVKLWLLPVRVLLPSILPRQENVTLLLMIFIKVRLLVISWFTSFQDF